MSFWTAIVCIILISAITLVMLTKYGVSAASRGKRNAGHLPSETETALRAELGQFKERLAVLERIATENDRGLTLERDIERLRDAPVN